MNNTDLTHLETLLAAATPGPWFNDQEDPIVESATEMIGQNILAGSHERDMANTELIVALRNAAPALIARVRELEAELESKEETIWEMNQGEDL